MTGPVLPAMDRLDRLAAAVSTVRSEAQVRSEELARLHAGENAYGASPAVVRALIAELARTHQYPEADCDELVAAIARHHQVDPRRVSVANGMDEVILLLVLALADPGRPAVITASTFYSYEASLRAVRQPFLTSPLSGYQVRVDDLAARLRAGAGFAFICNPHNPTGHVLDLAALRTLREAATTGDAMLIVDEAYAEFAGRDFASSLPAAATGERVCVMRTFSKAYGLAGLRVGYLVGPPALVERVNALHAAVPYHVNRLAQRAAVAALADQAFMDDSVARTVGTRDRFRRELTALGFACPPSYGNFVLVRVGVPGTVVTQALAERGYRVRDTTELGLPDHVRVSIGTPDEMTGVAAAIAEVVDRISRAATRSHT